MRKVSAGYEEVFDVDIFRFPIDELTKSGVRAAISVCGWCYMIDQLVVEAYFEGIFRELVAYRLPLVNFWLTGEAFPTLELTLTVEYVWAGVQLTSGKSDFSW